MHSRKKTKLQISRTSQKMAKNIQKVDRVITLMKTMTSQNKMAKSWLNQKTMVLHIAGYLFCEDSKHQVSLLCSSSLLYHLRAASWRPAMFLVTQKSILKRMHVKIKVDRYWSVSSLNMR